MNVGNIFCDMDGVLVNFYDGVIRATGKHIDLVKGEEKKAVKKAVFESGPKFWEDLQPMPDFFQLWNFIKPFNPYILTAAPHKNEYSDSNTRQKTEQYAKEGKWVWCQRYLHIPYDRFILVSREYKSNYATSVDKNHVVSNVLIDDTAQNIQEWRMNRGIGILHKTALNTISELGKLGFGAGGGRRRD